MSVSKFESLPNEILVELFEEYINGIDVLVAFCNQLNQRINGLIKQCRRVHFNYVGCRRHDFCLCIDLLSAYTEKIDVLSLSEQNTPGQIRAFLSYFPSFASFKSLHKLDFYVNIKTDDWPMIEAALRSLSHTSIEILSIKLLDAHATLLMEDMIIDLFRIITLKKLSFDIDCHFTQWNQLSGVTSNVEDLTILDTQCTFEDFESILRCAPHLKYFHIRIDLQPRFATYTKYPTTSLIRMARLHTLILEFVQHDQITCDMLGRYFKAMPNLYRFEMKANSTIFNGNAWEILLQTSLPSLVYFDLSISTHGLRNTDIFNVLASFQSPFWIERKNFNIIVATYRLLNCNRCVMNRTERSEQVLFNLPVGQWWIAPLRGIDDNFCALNNITSLDLSVASKPLPRYYHFGNINHLIVSDLDKDLLDWIITYINCSRIESVDISGSEHEPNAIRSLLARVIHINALRIKFTQLLSYPKAYLGKANCLECLDLSTERHRFDEEDIVTISNVSPHIQHLAINTQSLYNAPMLKNYLPRLRSLTYKIFDNESALSLVKKQKTLNYKEDLQKQSWSYQSIDYVTVWIDEETLKEH